MYEGVQLNTVQHDDVNIYATQISNKLSGFAKEHIATKIIKVWPQDLPWTNGSIRKLVIHKKYTISKNNETYNSFKKTRMKENLKKTILTTLHIH